MEKRTSSWKSDLFLFIVCIVAGAVVTLGPLTYFTYFHKSQTESASEMQTDDFGPHQEQMVKSLDESIAASAGKWAAAERDRDQSNARLEASKKMIKKSNQLLEKSSK